MEFFEIAKEEAKIAMIKGEVPVGVVITMNGEIIGRAHNLKETLKDSTAHGEILAIKQASQKIGDWRLKGAEMYVTLEPCPMCASAIIQSRISRLYIGTFNKDMGACGSVINIAQNKWLNSFIDIKWLYDKECSNILSQFFNNKRNK